MADAKLTSWSDLQRGTSSAADMSEVTLDISKALGDLVEFHLWYLPIELKFKTNNCSTVKVLHSTAVILYMHSLTSYFSASCGSLVC